LRGKKSGLLRLPNSANTNSLPNVKIHKKTNKKT